MNASWFFVTVTLALIIGAPIASTATNSSSQTGATFALNPNASPIGKIVEINGTAQVNASISVLFGGVTVANTTSDSNGSFRSYFVVPLLNSGKYNVSITIGGTVIGSPKSFQITYGINDITSAIQSIASAQTAQGNESSVISQQLFGVSDQLSQIISAQSKEAGELQNLTSNQNASSTSQTNSFQQNLLIYLSVVTAAALAVTVFSVYSLYRLKQKRFEELEIIQSGALSS